MIRPVFSSTKEYGRYFTDVTYWSPYVSTICERHGLGLGDKVKVGLAGTHPVFLINDVYVVKFFSDLFDGARSFAVECAVSTFLQRQGDCGLPVPPLIATGHLFDDHDGSGTDGWSWPYIVTGVIAGQSLTSMGAASAHRADVAEWTGRIVKQLHSLPIEEMKGILRPTWNHFVDFLKVQRLNVVANYKKWGTLPDHLVGQLEDYLPEIEDLIDRTHKPVLLHCDLNSDHIFGEIVDDQWCPSGIIDFGDARVGDPLYELGALHCGLFDCNKHSLRTFLTAYGFDEEEHKNAIHRMMAMALLHNYTVLAHVFENIPEAKDATSLVELAELIWYA